MTVNKRKKNSRQRGQWTHGWGAKKKHRGAGNRGGRGMAGTGAKADCKKPSIWGDVHYFGKYGFISLKKRINAVNLDYFEKNLDNLVEKKLAEKQSDHYVIDCKKLKIDKVLSAGNITKKLKITAKAFSKKAAEKIRKAGGEAILIKKRPLAENKKTETKKPAESKTEE